MQDILKKYTKQKKISYGAIIITSLIGAIGLNLFVLDESNIANTIKTNILETQLQNKRSDIYAQKEDENIHVYSQKNMQNVKNISMSIGYNPENVSITINKNKKREIIELSNEKGILSLLISFHQATNIDSTESIISISAKKQNSTSEQINIFHANFIDTNNQNYLLSTSGITF